MTDNDIHLRAIVKDVLGVVGFAGSAMVSEDLGADSMDVIILIMSIEDGFHISIPVDQEAAIAEGSYGDLLALVDAGTTKAAAA